MEIIGRTKENTKLQTIYNSGKPELVVVKGRRRIGKTYLINNTFENKFTFKHTGISPVDMNENKDSKIAQQLDGFYLSLRRYGYKGKKPANWLEAFFLLERLLESKDDGKRQVVFIDELPWLDTPRSNFISSFEQFWNNWGSTRGNLMLIVCGSSNSWINDNLINNYGGLYNRITQIIDLNPFNLKETKKFFEYKQIVMSEYDIVQSYMIFGGIPFYLDQLDKSLSLAQNVNELFFSYNSVLKNEFDHLFKSAFKSHEEIKKIVISLAKKRKGLTKKEITEQTSISDGGSLSSLLQALIASNIIIKYVPFGKNKNENYYKLIDPFCLFYLYFVNKNDSLDKTFWQDNQNLPKLSPWRGQAFEDACFAHQEQIKRALGIQGVHTEIYPWRCVSGKNTPGAQIDMLIDRADRVVNVCEMKFVQGEFSIDKDYDEKLRNKIVAVTEQTRRRKNPQMTLVTTYGLKNGIYSGRFQKVITLNDLFDS